MQGEGILKSKGLCLTAAFLAVISFLALLFPSAALALEKTEDDETEAQAELAQDVRRRAREAELDGWQEYFDELASLGVTDSADAAQLVAEIAERGLDAEPRSLLETMCGLLLPGVKSAAVRLVSVAAIALLTGLAGVAVEGGGARKLVLLVLGGAAVLELTALFSATAASVNAANLRIADFLSVTAPILGFALTGAGCVETSRLLVPSVALVADGIAALIGGVIMPLLTASGVLTVLSGLSGVMKLERSTKLIHKTVKWLLGLATTVYTAVTTLGGAMAAASDGVSIRAAKYAIDKMIPVGGALASGAVDALTGGAGLVKNAVGVASVLLLAAIALRPLLSLLASMLAFRLISAVIEPFADERIPKTLDQLADTLGYMLSAAACALSMFLLTVLIMLLAGGTLV